MKKFLLFSLLLSIVFSCSKKPSPKETVQEFITALSGSDLVTTSDLVSADTKGVLDKARKEVKQTVQPQESFQFATLAETVSGNSAEVKNEIITVPLVKEKEGWKVVLNESLLNDVQGREERLSQVKTKWEALQKEYEGRMTILREYVNYKKSMGTLSPKVALLNEAVTNLSSQKTDTKESRVVYVQKQQQLTNIIDAALEPTLAANTDLSLSYFLRINNAGDRIKQAENEYQLIAEKANSPMYVSLPVNAANPLNTKSN